MVSPCSLLLSAYVLHWTLGHCLLFFLHIFMLHLILFSLSSSFLFLLFLSARNGLSFTLPLLTNSTHPLIYSFLRGNEVNYRDHLPMSFYCFSVLPFDYSSHRTRTCILSQTNKKKSTLRPSPSILVCILISASSSTLEGTAPTQFSIYVTL